MEPMLRRKAGEEKNQAQNKSDFSICASVADPSHTTTFSWHCMRALETHTSQEPPGEAPPHRPQQGAVP